MVEHSPRILASKEKATTAKVFTWSNVDCILTFFLLLRAYSWMASVRAWTDVVVEPAATVRTSSLGIPMTSASVSLALSVIKSTLEVGRMFK